MESVIRRGPGQRKDHYDANMRAARQTYRQARLLAVLKAARAAMVSMRMEAKGLYRIHPGNVVALCAAVDEAWDCVKGVDE